MWEKEIIKPINGPTTSIGYLLPILTLFIVLVGFVYYIYLIQKGKLSLNETVVWILFTLLMVFISLYLLTLQIMSTFDRSGYNIFNHLASLFGLVNASNKIPEWLVFIILVILAFIYAKIFHSTLKISKLRKNVGLLSKEIAIINGKLEKHLKTESDGEKKKNNTKNNDN